MASFTNNVLHIYDICANISHFFMNTKYLRLPEDLISA